MEEVAFDPTIRFKYREDLSRTDDCVVLYRIDEGPLRRVGCMRRFVGRLFPQKIGYVDFIRVEAPGIKDKFRWSSRMTGEEICATMRAVGRKDSLSIGEARETLPSRWDYIRGVLVTDTATGYVIRLK